MKLTLAGVRLPLTPFALEMDFQLDARVTGIFGPSGAGKTSLLEIIAGLRRPAAGRVTLDGTVLSDADDAPQVFLPPERRGIGYVPQDGALFPHLSVRDNLLYGHGRSSEKAARAGSPDEKLTFAHVTAVLEISALAGRAVGTLSGGEQRRVALGRALLAAPRLLLLDEPLAGLDTPLRERLLPCLARVRDEFGVPMLHVTHAPDEVMELCDEVLVLAQGRLSQRGRPAGLFVAAASPRYVLRDRMEPLPPQG